MFYLIDKKKGISSFSAIKEFARENNINKIGHTGTLDPLATGLLLVATDEDTKLIDYIDKGFKTYKATMEIGKESNTYDSEGEIKEVSSKIYTFQEVEKTLNSFIGKSMQKPPIFSAKKVDGKRAYDLARDNKEVELKEVEIEIKEIKNLEEIKPNIFSFEVTVSRGTYIRSLIHDIGKKLNSGAIMTDLDRTRIGNIDKTLVGKNIDIESLIVLPIIELKNVTNLMHGKVEKTDKKDGKYAVKYSNEIVGIVDVKDKKMSVIKMMGNKLK